MVIRVEQGKRCQRSLCHALPKAARNSARLVASGQTQWVALPGRSSGYRNAHRAIAEDRMPELLALFAADRQARFAGKAPAMAPVASLDPGEFSAFPGKNAYDSFQGAPKWTNQVTLRSLEMFLEHDALSYADKIGPVPLLMIVEDEDGRPGAERLQPGAGAEEDRFLPRRSLRGLCCATRPSPLARPATGTSSTSSRTR